jgi:organic hydroperoxide reductase OsmC/OhrA
MDTSPLYHVELKWEAGRKGHVSSPVLDSAIEVATPPEFPKGVPGIWSPEHLLVAAVNSCLMTTFLAIVDNSKLSFVDFECKATGKLEKIEGKYMISEITLSPKLTLAIPDDEEKGLKILQKSEAACLISNSVRSRIVFIPEVKIQQTITV